MSLSQGPGETSSTTEAAVRRQERMREYQRSLQKTQRELDRERGKLEAQEKKLIADIKKSARDGQMVSEALLCDRAP